MVRAFECPRLQTSEHQHLYQPTLPSVRLAPGRALRRVCTSPPQDFAGFCEWVGVSWTPQALAARLRNAIRASANYGYTPWLKRPLAQLAALSTGGGGHGRQRGQGGPSPGQGLAYEEVRSSFIKVYEIL